MKEITKEELEFLYLNKGWNQTQCAKYFEVKNHVIKARLEWFKIPIKPHFLSGKKQSDEHKKKRIVAATESLNSKTDEEKEEIRKKISENNRASNFEVRKKNSEAHLGKEAWNKGMKFPEFSGENHPNFGKEVSEETREKLREANLGKKQSPELIEKRIAPLRGRRKSEEVKQKIRETNLKTWSLKETLDKVSGENNPCYRGYFSRGICSIEKYGEMLIPYEEICEDPNDPGVLMVRCTYCGRFMVPSYNAVQNRLKYINGNSTSESRFYCSDDCKNNCPIFGTITKPRLPEFATSREVSPELRKMCFRRDNWTCLKCGEKDNLHCHHIDPVINNPIESADLDNVMTVCSICHDNIHKKEGCKYHQLRCNK